MIHIDLSDLADRSRRQSGGRGFYHDGKALKVLLMIQPIAIVVRLMAQYRAKPPFPWNEPTLDEILADPIIKDLMAADGINAATVRSIMSRAATQRGEIPL